MYLSINPATEEKFLEYKFDEDIETILSKANSAAKIFGKKSLNSRLELIQKIKTTLPEYKEIIAEMISKEMGKLYSEAQREVVRAIEMCNFLLENAETALKDREIPEHSAIVRYESRGVVFLIMPWNYPFWLPLRSALPALAAGNAVIFKPAPNVSGTGKLISEIFSKIGINKDLFQTVLLENKDAEKILADKRVSMLSFTGSVKTGSHLGSLAGKYLKPSVLELGGSDPFIVLDDANLDLALEHCIKARLSNAGQVCCSGKRIIISEKIYDKFLSSLLDRLKIIKPGDPFRKESFYGPMSSSTARELVLTQVEKAISGGAKLLLAPEKIGEKGFYLRPGVITDLTSDNPVYQEEIFGPVFSIFKFNSIEEALEISNSSNYGLGSAVYTESKINRSFFANNLENGIVSFNQPVGGNPWIPFGGVKKSGYGRESSEEGLKEFCRIKSIINMA